jgi:hypothetical protein
MAVSIHFKHQAPFQPKKSCYKVSHWMQPPTFEVAKLAVPPTAPKNLFTAVCTADVVIRNERLGLAPLRRLSFYTMYSPHS